MPASHFVKALAEVTKVNGERIMFKVLTRNYAEETSACDALLKVKDKS
jgi:hypothetical protein